MTSLPPDRQHPPPRRKVSPGLIVTLLIVGLIGGVGILTRVHDASSLHRATERRAVANVVVIKPEAGPSSEDIVLPGTVQAWHEAPIFARTNGYLKEWKTDIGSPVKTGDLLAEIDTPEVDAQLHQAEADLVTAQANNQLAQSTAERWRALVKTNSVSRQDADEKISAAAASAAAAAASQANVDRLNELESFKRVIAPFDGVITARNTDNGALINAGSNGTAPELFHIAETDKLRIYVQVPEPYTPFITPDLTAELHFADIPGEIFSAKLVRTANALDPVARTLLIELEADNEKGTLMPGDYAEVHIKIAQPKSTVRLPVNTLLFRAQGLQVATVDADNHVHLKPITVGRDFGNDVEVQFGVAADDNIVVNPPDSLAEGQQVRIVTPKADSDEDSEDSKDSKTK